MLKFEIKLRRTGFRDERPIHDLFKKPSIITYVLGAEKKYLLDASKLKNKKKMKIFIIGGCIFLSQELVTNFFLSDSRRVPVNIEKDCNASC